MANCSDDSAEEFYDAADNFVSKSSDSGEESGPVWPSFSRPKLSLICPPLVPSLPAINVPVLPAPPAAGTPRARPLRSFQPLVPSKVSPEQKPNDDASTRGEFLQKHVGANGGAEDTPTKRRRKLDDLRSKLRSFEIGDEEMVGAHGEKMSSPSDASSLSDLASLASWSKHFLNSVPNSGNTEKTVVAEDSPSLGAVSKNDNEAATKSVDSEAAVSTDAPVRAQLDIAQPVSQLSHQTVTSSSSSSSASSNANTLEKSYPSVVTPLSVSAAANRRPSSARSSKSNSLPKDVASISACEHFLFSSDSDDLATLARKNSEAAEVIEALTNEIVRKAEIERDQLQKSSSSITESGRREIEADGIATEAVAAPGLPLSMRAMEGEIRRRSLRSGNGLVKEPDIVTSNRVKLSGSADCVEERAAESVAIAKPPRARRSTDSKANAVGVTASSEHSTSASADITSNAPDTSDKCAVGAVMVKNLDTGEKIPLLSYDEKSPPRPCVNPLALRILELTEREGNVGSDCFDTDSESMVSSEDVGSIRGAKDRYLTVAKEKTLKYKKYLQKKVGRAVHKTVGQVKHIKDEVSQHWHKEDSSHSDEEDNSESSKMIRVRASHHHKGPYHFDQIKMAQDLSSEHTGSVWSIKFSHCGRVMATAGQDKDIRVWVLKESFDYFNNMRLKYSAADTEKFNSAFMSPVPEDIPCGTLSHSTSMASVPRTHSSDVRKSQSSMDLSSNVDAISLCSAATCASASMQHDDLLAPFVQKPFCIFKGHSADVLDLCWSKNFFLLSSGMDRTVRLWHISRKECLCCFQHAEFVTAIAFLPKDDRYFLSASLDGILRVWHIPEKKVALWNEVEGGKLITALTFARNGKFVVVGTTDGRCVFYTTDLLVTSSDSRIRLYDTRDLSLSCKYKGYYNYGSQIRASFSHDGKYIVCGSEDKNVYLWKTVVDTDMLSLSVRKDRNRRWESIRAHNAVVTAAVFAPRPDFILQQIEQRKQKISNVEPPHELRLSVARAALGEVLVTADFNGAIYVFFNKPKVKLGGSVFLPSY